MHTSTTAAQTSGWAYDFLNAKYGCLAVTLVLILRVIIIVVYRLFFHPLAGYPGPPLAKVSDLYGAWHSLMGQLHIETERGHRKYGPIFRQGPNKIVANTATALHVIYHSKKVRKSQGYKAMLPSPGAYNTFTSVDAEMHRRKRRAMSQGLTDECVRRFEPTMLAHVDTFVKRLGGLNPSGAWSTEAFDMTDCCRHLAYDIMGEFGFGRSLRLQTSDSARFLTDAVDAVMLRVAAYVQYPALQTLGLDALVHRYGQPMPEKYARLMSDLVQSRLAAGGQRRHDLFSFLSDDADAGFSVDELWAESRFLLIAGGDTASTVLASIFFYLAAYPECFRKLAVEVRTTFASAAEIRWDTKLASCRYLRACVDEAMRMSPPIATTLWREVCAGSGLAVDGLLLPGGVDVGISPYALHHNEQLFPDSFTFRPERWIVSADNTLADVERARHAFSVFSIGPRACAGRKMAYVELSDALARAVWYLDLRPAHDTPDPLRGGRVGARHGRHRPREFQLEDHITCRHDGPYLQFRVRQGAEQDTLRLFNSGERKP